MKLNLKRLFFFNNLLTSLVPLLFVGIVSLVILKTYLQREMDQDLLLFARGTVSQITRFIKEPVDAVGFAFREMESGGDRDAILDRLIAAYPYFNSVFLLDVEGKVRHEGFKHDEGLSREDLLGMDLSDVAICKAALADNLVHWRESVSLATGEPVMTFCTSRGSGTILAEMHMHDLGQIINDANRGGIFRALVVDQAGRVIVHSDEAVVKRQENLSTLPIVRKALDGGEALGEFNFNGVGNRGATVKVPELGWVLVTYQDLDKMLAPYHAIRQIMLGGFVTAMLLALSLGRLATRSLRKPFDLLAEDARRVIREEYDTITPISSRIEEVELLSKTLRMMVETVRTRETQLNRTNDELLRAERELRELNLHLEKKVKERTEQLAQANHELVAVNDDLVERERSLENANHQLEAFAYSVSHDLRAPLRHASSFASILLEDHGSEMGDDARALMERILNGCRRMDELIAGILEFSRVTRQSLSRIPLDTTSLVKECLEELKDDLTGRQVELAISDLPESMADPLLLRQVWSNLLGNALKYTRKKETARIEAGSFEESGERVFYVKDNGAGFDSSHAEKLFGVFQRLHTQSEFEGTGVGLAIVANIIQRHGGRIWAKARPDEGATFFFTLPG